MPENYRGGALPKGGANGIGEKSGERPTIGKEVRKMTRDRLIPTDWLRLGGYRTLFKGTTIPRVHHHLGDKKRGVPAKGQRRSKKVPKIVHFFPLFSKK